MPITDNLIYRLKPQAGDANPHNEVGTGEAMTGGAPTLTNTGANGYAWRFNNLATATTALSTTKFLDGTVAGGGITFAIRFRLAVTGPTSQSILRWRNSADTMHAIVRNGAGTALDIAGVVLAEGQQAGYGATSVTTAETTTHVWKLVALTGSNTDTVQYWKEMVGRVANAPTGIGSGASVGQATLSTLDIISSNSADHYIHEILLWGRELTDAECAAVADDINAALAPAAPTIGTDQGSYSLTGQSANLLFNRKLTAEYGTHNLTGQDVGLLFNRLVSAAQGSYALTGQDATLTYTQPGVYSLTAEYGTYNWTVSDAFADYTMVAMYDTYALTGQNATLTFGAAPPENYSMIADAGSYSLVGRSARLTWSNEVITTNGNYTISMSMKIGI